MAEAPIEIETAKNEIIEICEEVEKGMNDVKKDKKLLGNRRTDRINQLKNRVGRAKQALKSLKVELRELPKLQAKPHADKAAQLEERIKQLDLDLEWLDKSDPAAEEEKQAMSTDYKKVVAKGNEVQMDDINRLGRVIRQTEETKVVGEQTLVTMQTQREQMIKIDQGVDEVASNIRLANRQMRVFVRRMATDKIVLGFLLLIFLGVIFIIVYSIVKPKAKTNVPQSWRT